MFFLFALPNSAIAQVYQPIDTTSSKSIKDFVSSFKSRHQKTLSDVKSQFSGEVKRKMESIYEEHYTSFVSEINKGELYFNDELNNYLEKIVKHITDSNPELKEKNFRIYFSREGSANAFSVGEGTLVVHLALLNTLKTEGELAGVIAHEMAHYTLDHSWNSIKDYSEKITSSDLKKQEKKITQSRYNKQESAEKLLKFVVYSRNSKSREFEFEADSKGYSYFKNTKYNQYDFVNALSRLNDADIEKDSLVNEDYVRFFTTKNQKFINEWTDIEDFSRYNYGKKHMMNWEIDSLKTHPNCDNRIEKIKLLNPNNQNSTFTVDASMERKLFEIAKLEEVFNLYYFKEYGNGLYEVLKMLKSDNKNMYLLKLMALNLEELSKAKKSMKFNSYIPNVNPKTQSLSKQNYISFMNNISTKELERLAKDYNELTQ
ncbi:M48 family metallopeptidase [Flavobacterium ardleyense]|uniref:M48 family metallopeptidase n=1 Tax=Flavobacterium ardleyense TaxID=2038737 RepID=A0ABW5Z7M4_9FLAO